ncbi:MAG: hypothetical protein U0791_23440 [Gemmataceae bacterium]
MAKTLVEQFVESKENMRLFQQERAIMEVTDLLEETLEELGISRSQFADMLGKSKAWVTQLLDEEGNNTIRTIADAFAVLGREFRSFAQPIRVSNSRETTPSTTVAIRDSEATGNFSGLRIIRASSADTSLQDVA